MEPSPVPYKGCFPVVFLGLPVWCKVFRIFKKNLVVSLFLIKVSNNYVGHAQWLCNDSEKSSKWLAFLPNTALWFSCWFIIFSNKCTYIFNLHRWNPGLKPRVDIHTNLFQSNKVHPEQQETPVNHVFQYFWSLEKWVGSNMGCPVTRRQEIKA